MYGLEMKTGPQRISAMILLLIGLWTLNLCVQVHYQDTLAVATSTLDGWNHDRNYSQTTMHNPTSATIEISEAVAEQARVKRTFNVTSLRARSGWPSWTEKFPFYPDEEEILADDTGNDSWASPTTRVCFVHIGKTAGSTVACRLGFQYPVCGTYNLAVVPGSLARCTTNIIHTRFDTCQRLTTGATKASLPLVYLVALRHPLARLQSWFTYERPLDRNSPQYKQKKPLFIDCHFRTLNELGLALTPIVVTAAAAAGTSNVTLSQQTSICVQRAWQAVTGQVGYSRHNKYNYGYYYNLVQHSSSDQSNEEEHIPPINIAPPRMVVIRTEHLATDWNAIQTQLFHDEPLTEREANEYFAPRANPSIHITSNDTVLTEDARHNLCVALCQEVATYIIWLHQAENLTPRQVQESLLELTARCPEYQQSFTPESCHTINLLTLD